MWILIEFYMDFNGVCKSFIMNLNKTLWVVRDLLWNFMNLNRLLNGLINIAIFKLSFI